MHYFLANGPSMRVLAQSQYSQKEQLLELSEINAFCHSAPTNATISGRRQVRKRLRYPSLVPNNPLLAMFPTIDHGH